MTSAPDIASVPARPTNGGEDYEMQSIEVSTVRGTTEGDLDSMRLSALSLPKDDDAIDVRSLTRTPSPTPSEAVAMQGNTKMIDWRSMVKREQFTTRRGITQILVTLIIVGGVVAFLVKKSDIEDALTPAAEWARDTPGGWLIPIAIMTILSFPPLFGHEVVVILTGTVWGLGVGFGISAAGTLLGELGGFFAFKFCCASRGRKWEEKRLRFAMIGEVVRVGGLRMAIITRYSLFPGHLLTAVFASCGMSVWIFLVSATLSLPKQLAFVYLGTASAPDGGEESVAWKAVKYSVLGATIVLTFVAAYFVNKKIDEVAPAVVYRRRKRRQQAISPFPAPVEATFDDPSTTVIASPAPSLPASSRSELLRHGSHSDAV